MPASCSASKAPCRSGEPIVELITAVGDRGGEVDAVSQLEGEDRRGMAGSQALQLRHSTTLPR